jgi:hypothetical protein
LMAVFEGSFDLTHPASGSARASGNASITSSQSGPSTFASKRRSSAGMLSGWAITTLSCEFLLRTLGSQSF